MLNILHDRAHGVDVGLGRHHDERVGVCVHSDMRVRIERTNHLRRAFDGDDLDLQYGGDRR